MPEDPDDTFVGPIGIPRTWVAWWRFSFSIAVGMLVGDHVGWWELTGHDPQSFVAVASAAAAIITALKK